MPCINPLPCLIMGTANKLGGAVAERVRAFDWRPGGPGFESRYEGNFASELWQFRLQAVSWERLHFLASENCLE